MKTFYFEPLFFKKFLVFFWTIWWAIAFLTDFFGGLEQYGLAHGSWIYAGNYPDLVKSLAMYHTPLWLVNLLFVAIIFGSFVCTLFFFLASAAVLSKKEDWFKKTIFAYLVSFVFWFLFIMADQFTMRFELIENHGVQLTLEILCLFFMFLVPDKI